MNNEAFLKMLRGTVNDQVQKDLSAKSILTLGELIARLEPIDKDRPGAFMQFDEPESVGGHNPVRVNSYRGYYDQLAVVPGDEPVTVRRFLGMLRSAIGETFQGYKGGDYTMTRSTFVWASDYGTASGIGIIGLAPQDDCIVIETEAVDV